MRADINKQYRLMAKIKVKNLTSTNSATTAHTIIVDKNDNVGPYLLSIADFLSLFGLNATNYRVVEYASGGAQNASASFDVYVFRAGGTLQLPDASTLNGQPVIVCNLTNNDTVVVNAYAGQSINDQSSITVKNSDSEQLIPASTGFVLTARNKIRSRSEALTYFTANPTLILDDGEQLFLRGSGTGQYKVGDGITPLSSLPWSNQQLTDYIATNDAAVANKQAKLNGGVGYVYSNNGVITYVASPGGGGGNMTSSGVTDGYMPMYNVGTDRYTNGYVYRDAINHNKAVFVSPTAGAAIHLDNTNIHIGGADDVTITAVSGKMSLVAPDITNDRVLFIDASGNVKTGTATPADLVNIVGGSSPFQSQINTINGAVVFVTGNQTINGVKTFVSSPIVPNPTTALQAANKAYVDQLAQGVQLKVDVDAVSTANITLSGSQTVDTVSSGDGKRILAKDQTTASQNGIYITNSGGAWTRATDMDASIEFNNATVQCRAGSTNINTQWTCTSYNPVVGTDPISFQLTSLSTTYNAGSGLDLTTNTFSIATGGVVSSMLANGAVDLSTAKVTGVLPQSKGGKGNATVYAAGSIVYQNDAGDALIEDTANLVFNNTTKTLGVNNILVVPSAGKPSIDIQATNSGSSGIRYSGSGSVIDANYSGGDYAIVINGTGANAKGIQITTKDIASDFTGENEVVRITQTGEASANITNPILGIYRDTTLVNVDGSFDATGPMLNIYDDTESTGHRILVKQQDNNQMALTKDGYLALGNVATIDAMIVLDGQADRTIKVAYNTTSNTAGKKLRLMGGSATVGSTDKAGGNVEVVTGSSRGNLGANFVIYATPPGSSGTGENSAIQQYIFKGDGRVGFGVALPAARFELWTPNGSNAFDIINKDQSTVNNTGWGWTPLTNGAGTNLVLYEKVSGVQTNRIVHHLNGNITIGNDSGTGDAKLNVKGTLKVEGGSPGTNKWLRSDSVGLTSWDYLPSYSMPTVTYSNTTTTNTDTNILTCSIPANTLVNDRDKLVYDFVIGNTGGISGDVTYKVKMNATALTNDKTVTLNTSSDPITLRVTIERLTSSTFRYTLQYNFSTHTTSLRTVEFATISSFDFTTSSTLYIIGNQLTTNRAISGVEGHGVYYKAI